MSSSSSSSSAASAAAAVFPPSPPPLLVENLPPLHQLTPVAAAPPAAEQLCYVHCHFCDTVLVVRDLTPALDLFISLNIYTYSSPPAVLYLNLKRFYKLSVRACVGAGERADEQPVQDGDGAVRPLQQPAHRQHEGPPLPGHANDEHRRRTN